MFEILNKYKYALIIVFFAIVISISYINYKNTERIIRDKYDQVHKIVETSILKAFKNINNTYKIAEIQLDKQMEEYSQVLKDKYIQNQDIYSWDLQKMKKEIDGFDIYVIDSQLKVIMSTFTKDIGLDFGKYPSFFKLLNNRLKGDSFVVDHLDFGTNTGELRKYSYIPTPDHKYLLELSVDVNEKYPGLDDLNIFAEAIALTKKYDSVEKVLFYKFDPKAGNIAELRNNQPINMDVPEKEKKFVEKTFVSNQMQTYKEESGGISYTHTFIPVLLEKAGKTEWWNTIIVRIIYNNDNMLKESSKNKNIFIVNVVILIAVFASFFFIIIYLLKKFEYMAYHDKLTGLPNRELFEQKISDFIEKDENRKNKMAIIFIDINKFKEINDNFGHNIGDELIKKTAKILRDSLRESDYISRLGGDEFLLGIINISSREEISEIIDRVINFLNEPIEIENSKFNLSLSLGISIYPEQGSSLEKLIKKADIAMYKAKQEQRNFIFYNEEM